MITSFPFTLFPLLTFNAWTFLFPGSIPRGWATPLFSTGLFSGGFWTFTAGDLLLIVGLFFLFADLLRATLVTASGILPHAGAIAVAVASLIEFLAVGSAGNSVFLLLTLISLVAAVAGMAVSSRIAYHQATIAQDF